MNNKNNIIIGGIVLAVVLVGVYSYFFIPGVAEYLSFSSSGSALDTDIAAIDVTISSSTDSIVPSSPDEAPIEQKSVNKKTVQAASSPKKVSGMTSEQDSTPIVDDNASETSASDATSQKNNSSSAIIPITTTTTICSFPSDTSEAITLREIILNEIAWMGSISSSNAEWIEIKNISGHDINLSGWKLLSASGKITISFSASDEIPASGLLLLSRNNSSTDTSYSGDLSNTGDILAIVDPQCAVSDYLDASSGWPAGNNTTKQTLERNADGIGWHTSVSPSGTPGAENSVIVLTSQPENNSVEVQTSTADSVATAITPPTIINSTSTEGTPSAATTTIDTAENDTATSTATDTTATANVASGHILIAAVQIAGVSSTNDFVKLYNPTEATVDMSAWKLHKRSSTGTDYSIKAFPTGSAIAPGHLFVWANSTNGFSEAIGANVSSTETLSADNSVALLDANGTIVDAVVWGTGTGQYGEGPPYPTDPTADQILTRQLVNGSMVDTSNNANDFILQ